MKSYYVRLEVIEYTDQGISVQPTERTVYKGEREFAENLFAFMPVNQLANEACEAFEKFVSDECYDNNHDDEFGKTYIEDFEDGTRACVKCGANIPAPEPAEREVA